MYSENKVKCLSLVIILCSSLLLATSLFANDMLVGESGHTVFPVSTDKIRLVSELVKVKIDTYNFKGVTSAARRAFVTGEFIFENTSNAKLKTRLGFPGDIFRWTDGVTAPSLNDFMSSIDGSEKKVHIKKEILNRKKAKYSIDGKTWKEEISEDYRYWYTWDVTFSPFQRITIKNTYWVTLSSDQENWWFEYILTNRANWKGDIEEALIEVIYSDEKELKNRVIEIKPAGYNVDKNRIYWEFRNFKPIENIKITEKWIEKEEWLKNK